MPDSDFPRSTTGSIAQQTARLVEATTIFIALKAAYRADGHCEASAIIEAGRETVRKTGLTELEAIVNNSPLVQEYRASRVTPRAPVLQMPARVLQETAGAQGAPRPGGALAALTRLGPCEVMTFPCNYADWQAGWQGPAPACGQMGISRHCGTVMCEVHYQALCVCEWCGGEQVGPGCCTACGQADTLPPTRPTAATISSIAAARAARAARAGEDTPPPDADPA